MKKLLLNISIACLSLLAYFNGYTQLSCYHVVIDPGHGGSAPGSSCSNGVTEKVLTLDMSLKLRTDLQGKGASVAMTRTTDVDVSLAARRDFINNENPDAAVSIHLNAYNGVIQGTETYWCAGTVSPALANQVQPQLVSVIGYADRGVKQSCFTVLTTNTSIPTILTEALFHDVPAGCTFINNPTNQTNIAVAHAVGIQNYLPPCNNVINNTCATAIQLQSHTTCTYTQGTLTGATASSLPKASCDVFGNPAKKDVFYSFIPSQTQHTIEIKPTGSGADAVDAVVSVYSGGSCTALTEFACGGGSGGSGGVTKTLNLTGLNVGQQYWIRLYDYGTIDPVYPNFEICVTHAIPTVINNNCTEAIQLQSHTSCTYTQGTLTGATASSLPKASCDVFGNPAKKDVFYYFNPSYTEHTIEIKPTINGANSVDAVISVFTGANCNSLTEFACGGGNGGGSGNTKTLNLTGLNILQQYWIRIYNYGTTDPLHPDFEICVTHSVNTNTEEISNKNSIKIYPNPAEDRLHIEAINKIERIKILNYLGQVVLSESIDNFQASVDISKLPSGFYLLEVHDTNGFSLAKFHKL